MPENSPSFHVRPPDQGVRVAEYNHGEVVAILNMQTSGLHSSGSAAALALLVFDIS